jgi:hypothetical protein
MALRRLNPPRADSEVGPILAVRRSSDRVLLERGLGEKWRRKVEEESEVEQRQSTRRLVDDTVHSV